MRALPFLEIPHRGGKPRDIGLTIVRDRMRPLRQQADFLDTYAAFVDYAKFSNISACLYPESFLQAKIDLYLAHRVRPMFGGLVYENAAAQGKLDEFVDYVGSRNAAVEISNNILDVGIEERLAIIERLRAVGVEVLCEVGEKYPTTPFDVIEMAREIERFTEAGVALVILERGEIDVVLGEKGDAPTTERLSELFERIDQRKLLAEVETKQHILYMIKTFGPEVNLGPNIDWELVPWLEPSRLGIGREIGHTTIAKAAGDMNTRTHPT